MKTKIINRLLLYKSNYILERISLPIWIRIDIGYISMKLIEIKSTRKMFKLINKKT